MTDDEIALRAAINFCATHSKAGGFSQSTWTQQEVGFALGRGAKIIWF